MSRIDSNQDLSTYTQGEQYITIESSIPWNAYHDNSIILGNVFNGHIFLKITCGRNPSYYYIGNATGITKTPIFLKDFYTKENIQTNMVYFDINDIAGKIIGRFKSQFIIQGMPDLLKPKDEKIVQQIMKYITSQYNILEFWIHMEIERIEQLLEFYTFENLQIIYPFIVTQDTYKTDIEEAYKKSIESIAVPDLNIFCWVKDVVINF